MVAKTISYYGKYSPITARVGVRQTADHIHCQDERRTGLLVPRGLLAGERGIITFRTLSCISVLNHAHAAYQLAVRSGKANPEPL
jgi:hypothetical protein